MLWVDPPALHANLSLLTNPVDDNLVSVTAVVGKNESEGAPADGIQFSYVRDSLVKHKCECLVVKTKNQRSFPEGIPPPAVLSPSPGSVDFPPVAVKVDETGHVLFQFEHPWLLYGSSLAQPKSRQKKSDEEKMPKHRPEFMYTLKVNQVGTLVHSWNTFFGVDVMI